MHSFSHNLLGYIRGNPCVKICLRVYLCVIDFELNLLYSVQELTITSPACTVSRLVFIACE